MLANNGSPVKDLGSGRSRYRAVGAGRDPPSTLLRSGRELRSRPSLLVPNGGIGTIVNGGGSKVRRLVRLTVRMVITSAVLGIVLRVGRAILGRLAGVPGEAIRTGSFDSWPTVPPAPDRGQPGE